MSPSLGRFRWLVAVSAMAIAAAACGPSASAPATQGAASAPASAPASGASAEPTAITGASCAASATVVKFWTSHTPPDSDTLKKIVDAFNAANADICVKMTIVPGSETDVTKLITSIRGGVAPDVYMADRFTVPQRAAEGVLAELPDDVAALKSEHLEFAWNETQFQGKTYAIPFDTDARALWYNKDLITAAGEDPAQLDISKGAPTIELVTKIADKINKKDASGNYDVMGWMPGGPNAGGNPGAFDQGWHYTWGFVFGGKFADLAACKVTPTDPGVEAGFQFLYDWQKAHDPQKVARWVSTNWPPNSPQQQFPFWTGKLGMTISGDWQIANAAKYAPNTKYGFTYIPVPKAGDKSATWAGGWSMALIPDSKAKDQAIKFMKYIAGPDGQKVYTKETTHLPTIKSLLQDASLFDAQHKTFLDLLPGALNRPPLAVGGIYWDALTSAQGSVELNTKTPDVALKEVEAAVQPQLTSVGC
ncbi:MAG TPA: ABC transporter substrate-binding protein [Candidatus Limnocylindria bacterium]|nr:ABC transporter substrate-binding protein [Candidatus Limnocylindria bacterium]